MSETQEVRSSVVCETIPGNLLRSSFVKVLSLKRKEGNVLFNDALNTFYLRLYGVRHMVKNHTDSKRGNPLPPHGLLFPIRERDGVLW